MGLFDKISNLIFEEDSTGNNESKKMASTPNKKRRWTDIFFEDAQDDDIKSTFVAEDEKTSVLNDISSQIEHRESELINLAEFF